MHRCFRFVLPLALCVLAAPRLAHATDGDDGVSATATPADASADALLPPDEPFDGFDWLLIPIVAYQPETSGLAAAIALLTFELDDVPDNGPSRTALAAAYTLKNQVRLTGSSSLRFWDYGLKLELEGRIWPQEYFGLGVAAPLSDEELMEFEDLHLGIRPRAFFLDGRLRVGIIDEFSITRITTGEDTKLRRDDPRGRTGGVLHGVGFEATWDTRNRSFSTTQGTYVDTEFIAYSSALGSEFDFVSWIVDLRQFVSLGRWGALAGQLYYHVVPGEPPFFKRTTLGGRDLVRGVFEWRFNGRHLLASQLEYRSPLLWRFGLVGFGGVGVLGEAPDTFAVDLPRWGIGAGVRFMVDMRQRIPIRFDVGFTEDDYGIYFSISEAF